jgi:hypothetical protein
MATKCNNSMSDTRKYSRLGILSESLAGRPGICLHGRPYPDTPDGMRRDDSIIQPHQ